MREYPLQYASTDKNKKSHYSNIILLSSHKAIVTPKEVVTPLYIRIYDMQEIVVEHALRCHGIKSDALVAPFRFQKHVHIKWLPIRFSNILQ